MKSPEDHGRVFVSERCLPPQDNQQLHIQKVIGTIVNGILLKLITTCLMIAVRYTLLC